MENSEVCEGRNVRNSRYEVTQIRIPNPPGEMEMPNMIRWSVFSRSNVRTPPLESNLIEFYLREEMFLAPVDPCAGYQRADLQGSDPQRWLGFLCDFVDDDVGDLLREGCFHEGAFFDACPTVSPDLPTLRDDSGREVSLSGLWDRR
jgi:hypothetical protein